MGWKIFVLRFLGWAVAMNATVLLLFVLIDPYGTSRFTFLPGYKIQGYAPRLANASRAANPIFDSAIIGNSTSQLLSPIRLNALTHRHFVNLSIPGTGPREQLSVLATFLRSHRERAGVLVIGIDLSWCKKGPFDSLKMTHGFPFWLYDASPVKYVRGLYSLKSVERSVRRIGVLSGIARPAALDGYDDYELGRTYSVTEAQQRLIAETPQRKQDDAPEPDGERFSYQQFDRLAQMIAERPSQFKTVLVFLPRYWPDISQHDLAGLSACKAKAQQIQAGNPSVTLVDFMIDSELTRTPQNFWDLEHYRGTIAERIERAVTGEVRAENTALQLAAKGIDFSFRR